MTSVAWVKGRTQSGYDKKKKKKNFNVFYDTTALPLHNVIRWSNGTKTLGSKTTWCIIQNEYIYSFYTSTQGSRRKRNVWLDLTGTFAQAGRQHGFQFFECFLRCFYKSVCSSSSSSSSSVVSLRSPMRYRVCAPSGPGRWQIVCLLYLIRFILIRCAVFSLHSCSVSGL